MTIRWRDLLDHLQVPWTDRGPNVSRGWIAIRCPWCGASDPSHHLNINEAGGQYHCFRSPSHAGKSPHWLLRALGVRGDFDQLLQDFGATGTPQVPVGGHRVDAPSLTPFARRWQSFAPAWRDQRALEYLKRRGFWNPLHTAERFDLRVGEGRWAGRLWFPLTLDGQIVGYTGRAFGDREPRYLTETADAVLYVPEWLGPTTRVVVIVEGPMDALKLADSASTRYDFAVAALCGLAITPKKRLTLLALARAAPVFYVALDSTMPSVKTTPVMRQLRMLPLERLTRLDMLPGVDDPGDMNVAEIEQWLKGTGIATVAAM